MCRISGIVDPSKSLEILEKAVEQMCSILQNGGPDGEGIYVSEEHHLVFGHRRLALLDLSEAGSQPMTYDEGRFIITYNGEIYNYPELKKELELLGYIFKTVCDTEMILAAFKAWGPESFKRFKGMFAFAILDHKQKQLFLARDPSGIKPLYYYQSNDKLYFASEVKALKIFEEINVISERAKVLLLAYGHIPESITSLNDVKMLPKGNYLTFYIGSGKSELNCYKSFEYEEIIEDRKEAIDIINKRLSEAVHGHLLSDAPIGVFLSGGIDSSLLTLLAHKYSGDHLNTLSIYFNEAKFSEKKFQDIVIEQAHCNHKQYLLDGSYFSEHFEQVVNDMDQPSIDGINTWFISKYAKDSGLKAVLSGLGSDELFGGYPSFRRMQNLKILKKLPSFILKNLATFSNNKVKRFAFLSIPGIRGEYLFLRGIFLPSDIAAILNIREKEVWKILNEVPLVPENKNLSMGNQASWMEVNLYMQNQLLRDSDVMSMAHGVEIRVPFLDNDVVETALKIDSKEKYSGKLPKQLLIDAFKNLLPKDIWDRKKMGFAFPFKDWLTNNNYVKRTIESNESYKKIYNRFLQGELQWAHVMALIVLDEKFKNN